MSIWHNGRFFYHPRRTYENGENQVYIVAKSKLDLDYLHLIISSFGYEDYKIWVVDKYEKFDEDGFVIETTNDFNHLIQLTKKNKIVSVVVQHMD